MGQVFRATERREFSNGAIGWAPGGPMDCLGPFAKVQRCPVQSDTRGAYLVRRYTCYATGYADTFFSIPACTRIHGKHVRGYLTMDGEGGVEFVPSRME